MPLPRSYFDEYAYEDFGPFGEQREDFFAPTDLGFVAQPAPAPAPAPVPGRIFDPLQIGFANIGEGEQYQTGFGNIQDYFNLAPLGDLSRFAKTTYGGEGEYLTRYDLPALSKYLSEQGMELREQDLPNNKVARWVQGPQGIVEGTYQEIDVSDKDFGIATALLGAAAGNIAPLGMGFLNAAAALQNKDPLGFIASAAGAVPGIPNISKDIKNIADTVRQGTQLAKAVKEEDPLGALAAGTALGGVETVGDYKVKDLLNYAKAAKAVAEGDAATALLSLQNVTPATDDETKKLINIGGNLIKAAGGDPVSGIKALISIGDELQLRQDDPDISKPITLETIRPTGAATTPASITAGEDVEEIPEEYQEPDYEQIAAGLPADLVMEQRYEDVQPPVQQVEVPGTRQLELPREYFEPTFSAPSLDEKIQTLIETPPAIEAAAPQREEIIGKRPQDQEFVPFDYGVDETAKLPEDIVKLIESPPAPQVIEVIGKREPVYDSPLPEYMPELFGGPQEFQRVDITGEKPELKPIDLDLDIKEPGPLIEPPEKLPKDIEDLVTTPPAVSPPPKPSPKPPARPSTPSSPSPTPSAFAPQMVAPSQAVPTLANVFYYGKEFGSPLQRLEDGELVQDLYRPLSVTDFQQEEAQQKPAVRSKPKEEQRELGSIYALIEKILQQSDTDLTKDDLLDIIKRG